MWKIDFQDSGCGHHLEFLIATILATLIYKLPLNCLPSFKSVDHLVKEKQCRNSIDFQDGSNTGQPSLIYYWNDFRYFYLHFAPILPAKFQVN